ncbi:MAG: hypothetical protein RLZZ11_2127 [Cyanobacteriota bacterium]
MDAALSGQRLLVMPDDGGAAVVELIDQACDELLLKQFKLQSQQIEQALFRARERGVRVRSRATASRWSGPANRFRSPTRNPSWWMARRP